jgi:hypothetical protein
MAVGSLVEGPDDLIVAFDCTADIAVKRVRGQGDYLSVKVEGGVRPWPTALIVSRAPR